LLACVVSCGGAGAGESPLETAKRLAVSDRREDRVKAFQIYAALKKPGTALGDEYTYRYAELCLAFHAAGEPRMLDEARRAFGDLETGGGSRWALRGKVGQFRVAAAEGRRDEAIRGLDRFLAQQTKCERAVEAAYYLGCLRAGRPDDAAELRQARIALEYALQLHEAVSRYNAPLVSAAEIRAQLDGVCRKLKELTDGRLKTLFGKAEQLRAGRKYDEAIAAYGAIRTEFPGERLAELSGLRVAECLRDQGRLKEAIARAQAFAGEDPLGAYRGQAHLLVGDICLERFFDVAGAEPEFRCLLEPGKAQPVWVAAERARFLAAQAAAGARPPEAAAVADETWKETLPHAHERVGIFEYLRRNRDKAIEHFEISQKLQPNKSYGDEPGQGMADLADKIRRQVEIVPEFLLAERAERPKLVLVLASLYLGGWRDEKALDLFRRVAGGEFKEASLNQKAYAQVKIAEGLFYLRKDDEAIKVLEQFEKDPWRKTAFVGRALLQLAVTINRKGDVERAMTYLDKCHAAEPNSEFGESAFYQKAFGFYALNRNEEARRLFREYAARYPNSWAMRQGHVAYFLSTIEKRLAEEKAQKDESGKK
jgi:tetratricopeptide (TPR) repeat protein